MKTATGNNVLKAYSRAAKQLINDPEMLACDSSAGFIVPKGGDEGIQVFVRLVRFSKKLLKAHPETGGLLMYKGGRE